MRPSAAALSPALIFSFLTSRSRLPSIAFTPRSTCAWAMSVIVTACPATANACAMPLPMVPAPTTPMVSIAIPVCSFDCGFQGCRRPAHGITISRATPRTSIS